MQTVRSLRARPGRLFALTCRHLSGAGAGEDLGLLGGLSWDRLPDLLVWKSPGEAEDTHLGPAASASRRGPRATPDDLAGSRSASAHGHWHPVGEGQCAWGCPKGGIHPHKWPHCGSAESGEPGNGGPCLPVFHRDQASLGARALGSLSCRPTPTPQVLPRAGPRHRAPQQLPGRPSSCLAEENCPSSRMHRAGAALGARGRLQARGPRPGPAAHENGRKEPKTPLSFSPFSLESSKRSTSLFSVFTQ